MNVANGNLVIHQSDYAINNPAGPDLRLDRYYNSFDFAQHGFGVGWHAVAALGFYGQGAGDKVMTLYDDSGAPYTFDKNSDGSYTSPAAIDATLVENADNSFKLTFHKTGLVENFAANGKLTSVFDKNGNNLHYSYYTSGYLSYLMKNGSLYVEPTLNPSGLVGQAEDNSGRRVSYTYDGSGHLTDFMAVTDATVSPWVGYHTLFGQSGMQLQITDPRGHVTKIVYDGSSRPTSITRVTNPAAGTGPTTSYTYNSGNTVVTDPDGNATTYYFDNQGRVTKVTNAAAYSDQTAYNANDDASSTTDALNKTTSYTYGIGGYPEDLTKVQLPTTAAEQLGYTDSGHPYYANSQTDAQGNSWTYKYDTPGNLNEKDEAAGANPVRFHYNSNGTVRDALDAKHNATSACPYDSDWGQSPTYCYGYDSNSNLNSITAPSPLGSVSLTYDSLNRIHTVTDGKGETRTYTYDVFDRVVQIAYTSGPTLSYTYDGNGNLTKDSDPTGSYVYGYDELNRLTSESLPGGGALAYGYDAASNLTGFTDASGLTTYTYNSRNLLATLLEPGASHSIGFQYDANGNVSEIDYPNGVSEYYTYDDSQRLASIVGKKTPLGTALSASCYSYKNGSGADTELRQSVTNVSSTIPGCPTTGSAATTSYSYDTLDRLVKAASAAQVWQYLYDANGNLCARYSGATSITLSSCSQSGTGITNYTVNAANELTGTGFGYDANGGQTDDSSTFSSASYNLLGQLSSVTPTGGSATALSYQSTGQAARTALGSVGYVNGALGLDEETGSPNTFYTSEPGGTILGERRSGSSYYFLFDGIGSVTAATDSSGNVVRTFQYDPYGTVTAQTGSLYEPVTFAGGYADATAGGAKLIKFGQRYYDPVVGRWTQTDALTDPLALNGWNQYDYAGDDPINNEDGSGTCIFCSDPLGLGKAFSDFGAVATGFIIGEGSCYIAGAILAPETGGFALLAAATVCAVAGVLEAHEIRDRYFRLLKTGSAAYARCRADPARCL